MNIPHMYIFDFNNMALTVVFLIISSIMAVEFSRQIKKAIDRKKT